jgi:serine-type D-Ala-D-Ala carboxypeptidase (penicillin-binding protein 5/6)
VVVGRRIAGVLALVVSVCAWLGGTGMASVKPAHPQPPPAPNHACSVPMAPPPPVDASERPKPGEPPPAPLPMPDAPVGGPRMGECGLVVAHGAPPPPAGESSASWILADLDSGAVLAAHNPHARERPASLLKVLTALVALRRLDLNTVVEGTQADANMDGSRVGVSAGGRYTVRQLLTGLIMNSGNDAANALARQLGGVPATLHAMSDTAAELGALDTRPASPSGLDAPGMATSAYDLAVVYRVVIQNPAFAEISRTRLFNWPGAGDRPGFEISNDNHLLTSYPGAIGGKTGFTDDARHTLISAADRGGRRLVAVLMRGEQRPVSMYTQAARLLDYGFALPRDTPPVGTLVEHPPGAPTAPTAPTLPPAVAAPQEHRLASLGVVGGGALLGMLLSVLIARRRREDRGGRHTV